MQTSWDQLSRYSMGRTNIQIWILSQRSQADRWRLQLKISYGESATISHVGTPSSQKRNYILHFHFYSIQKWKNWKAWPSTFQRQIALYSPGWSVSPLILPPQNLTERSETKLIMIYEYMLGKRTPSAVIPRQSYTQICNFLTKMLPIKFYHKNFPPKQFHRKFLSKLFPQTISLQCFSTDYFGSGYQ